MSDKAKPKSWSKPQLIVIGRGTPEESVLTACKIQSNTNTRNAARGCNRTSCNTTSAT